MRGQRPRHLLVGWHERRTLVAAVGLASANAGCAVLFPLDEVTASSADAGSVRGAPSAEAPAPSSAPPAPPPSEEPADAPPQTSATRDAGVVAADGCDGFPAPGDDALLIADAEADEDGDPTRARESLLPPPLVERGLWFPPGSQGGVEVAREAAGCSNQFIQLSIGERPLSAFGFNFRSGYSSGYVDLREYRGVRFWARSVPARAEVRFELVDAARDGDCCAARVPGLVRCVELGAGCLPAPSPDAGACVSRDVEAPGECFRPLARTTLAWDTEWRQFTIDFDELEPPADVAGLQPGLSLQHLRSLRFVLESSLTEGRLQLDQLELLRAAP